MQIAETPNDFEREYFDSGLWKFFVFIKHTENITAGAEFKDDPEVVSRFIIVMKLQYVRVFKRL
jgi:hypothetical protein